MTFSRKILLGLVLGVATGLLLGDRAAPLRYLADAFIRLLQMTVLPYVTVSLVAGISATVFGVTYDRDYQFSYEALTPYYIGNSVGLFVRRAIGGRDHLHRGFRKSGGLELMWGISMWGISPLATAPYIRDESMLRRSRNRSPYVSASAVHSGRLKNS